MVSEPFNRYRYHGRQMASTPAPFGYEIAKVMPASICVSRLAGLMAESAWGSSSANAEEMATSNTRISGIVRIVTACSSTVRDQGGLQLSFMLTFITVGGPSTHLDGPAYPAAVTAESKIAAYTARGTWGPVVQSELPRELDPQLLHTADRFQLCMCLKSPEILSSLQFKPRVD